jgi:hypothetical protein
MFWLPPGGTDNGVWAAAWAELADLDADDVGPVLGLLARAGVGGYVATQVGARTVANRWWSTGYGRIRCNTIGRKT